MNGSVGRVDGRIGGGISEWVGWVGVGKQKGWGRAADEPVGFERCREKY